MTYRLALRRAGGKIGESFLFICGQHDMTRQSQHLEELDRLAVYLGEHHQRAALFCNVNDAQQDGDSDAINEFGVAEIDDQRAGAGIELLLTFALDSFPGELVQIVARVDDGCGADAVRANV